MPGKNDFDIHYSFLLQRVLKVVPQLNRRTGRQVKAIDGACFRLGTLPILNLRDINPLWTCAETVWFMGGRSDAQFMRDFGFKNWDAFTDGTGKVVPSATGLRWRQSHGVDQLGEVIRKLDRDPSDRQAVMVSWLPEQDLMRPGPNVPCLIAWHLHKIWGYLHMTVMQRSADLYFGLPHDILGARLVQEIIAKAVELEPGNLTYVASNAHLYDDQWEAGKEMVAREETCTLPAEYPVTFGITDKIVKGALRGDPDTVHEIMALVKRFYRPFPPLRGPKVVA